MNRLYKYLTEKSERNRMAFIQAIEGVYNSNGYPIRRNDDAVNILGIRSVDKDTSRYNDVCIFFTYSGAKCKFHICEFTTDPSDQNLLKPINGKGCAILKEGYYKGLWSLGYHKGKSDHRALIQTGKCVVYRDNNKDTTIDIGNVVEEGLFGINCHRASLLNIKETIGLNSAGCQVFKRSADLATLVNLCEKDVSRNKTKSFDYVLFKEKQGILCTM